MNKETGLILDCIDNSEHYLGKVKDLKQRFTNVKDFQNQFLGVIVEIISEEKKFINLKRTNIEVPELALMFFER